MQLLLVRHGEPLAAEAEPGAAHGADPALSTQGERQAHRLADWLAASPEAADVAEVVVSPMRRAQQTAAPLLVALGAGSTVCDGLAEFDRGRASYRPVHERTEGDPEWERIRVGQYPSFVDGAAFGATVVGAVDAVADRHPGRATAVLVCHAGVINTYLATLLGLERPLMFPLDHGSVSRVLVSRTGERRVRSVNETQHVVGLL